MGGVVFSWDSKIPLSWGGGRYVFRITKDINIYGGETHTPTHFLFFGAHTLCQMSKVDECPAQPPTVLSKMKAQLESITQCIHILHFWHSVGAYYCNKLSVLELSRKFTKSALLVGWYPQHSFSEWAANLATTVHTSLSKLRKGQGEAILEKSKLSFFF